MRKERKRPGELERRPDGNSGEIHERRPNEPDIRYLRGRFRACVILRIVCHCKLKDYCAAGVSFFVSTMRSASFSPSIFLRIKTRPPFLVRSIFLYVSTNSLGIFAHRASRRAFRCLSWSEPTSTASPFFLGYRRR